MSFVCIFGGSGFIGRYVAREFANHGWRVRVAVRRPNQATFARPLGQVGQVEPFQVNIRDEQSTRSAVQGAEIVVNLVGIINETSKQKFTAIHADGAAMVARAATAAKARSLVHVSALGADANSHSKYGRSKFEGEKLVQGAFKGAHIIRPSAVVGPEDRFFNSFAGISCLTPIMFVPALETKIQPIRVGDVARAIYNAATCSKKGGIYEIGGPDIATLRDWLVQMLKIVRRDRLLLNTPMWMAQPVARFMGLFPNPLLTTDKLAMLSRDIVVSKNARKISALGIEPASVIPLMRSYLHRFSPRGQYEMPIELLPPVE